AFMLKRVLVIAYQFPPVGGAGVQRVTKFVKYLPDFGWQPSVLTVSNPSVPVIDQSLVAEIPEQTVIRAARTFEPGYRAKQAVSAGAESGRRGVRLLRRMVSACVRTAANTILQPDPQVLWRPAARRAALRLLEEFPHQAILATGPPFSSFLLAADLSRRCGLPLVLDYRDEWDISNSAWENKRQGPLTLALQAWMQRRAARQAGALIATTQSSAQALDQMRRRAAGTASVSAIYNGFDPAEFSEIVDHASVTNGYLRLAYIGTLWNLTDVAPLVHAVQLLDQQHPDLASRLELVFAGRRTPAQQSLVDQLSDTRCRLVCQPYLDHDQALKLMRSSHLLCLLLADAKGAGRVVPAKVFEYMACRKRILAIAPPGEVSDILTEYPAVDLHVPTDVRGIANSIVQAIELLQVGTVVDAATANLDAFDRRRQAGQLAQVLDDLAGTSCSIETPVESPAAVAASEIAV
ncbi:MAG: glycosyltransferase, partial [Planctomycetaceae bacterium]